jgi:hypothetical protein
MSQPSIPERLAILETEVKHVKASQDEMKPLVFEMHGKMMQGTGAVSVLRQGGAWLAMLISGTLGAVATTAFHKIWG